MTTSQLMPSHVVERVMQKRGRMRIFDRFVPSRTALVVIDMQRFYVEGLPPAARIIPVIRPAPSWLPDRPLPGPKTSC